ncbi:hypothetical protein [Enterococcus mundtii]|uniref:hypothetical protein n=1 Tax=Enterococcus mundtii TaxID=53346 RepID=UPI0035C6CE4B
MIVNAGYNLGIPAHNRGFFSVTDGATISGITLENPRVVGGLYGNNVGGLIGPINDLSKGPTAVTDSTVSGGSIGSKVGITLVD